MLFRSHVERHRRHLEEQCDEQDDDAEAGERNHRVRRLHVCVDGGQLDPQPVWAGELEGAGG